MSLTEGNLAHTARNMVEKKLLRQLEGQRANTQKYSQLLCNTLLGEYQFSQPEFAVVCLLMLRGPQTPGNSELAVAACMVLQTIRRWQKCCRD